MSVPVLTAADLPAPRAQVRARRRLGMRTASFAALCLYGVDRWGRLMAHPPGWRLVGLAALAVAITVLVPLVRHLTAPLPRPVGRLVTGITAAVLGLAVFPVAGLHGEWVWHARIAVSARTIGSGLRSLGDVLVPYLGHAYPIRLVITLGAAVLLLDAAAALAVAGRGQGELGDGRKAAAALPLLALAVVPATLVRPAAPALQGLILFGLLSFFMWGERIAADGRLAAVVVTAAAGLGAAIAAPLIESGHPWVDYRAWAGSTPGAGVESFAWNQTYGSLAWPQRDRTVLLVRARRGDYWKATDLSQFDGTAWVVGPDAAADAALPQPVPAVRRRFTQTVTVTVDDLSTSDVIGGSGVTSRPQLAGGVRGGSAAGTWVAARPLGPGDVYSVTSYSPRPSAAALRRVDAVADYPWSALTADLTLTLPVRRTSSAGRIPVTFPAFHRPVGPSLAATMHGSPYARVFTLARRLAGASSSPYAFVVRIERLLDGGRYAYDQRPPSIAGVAPLIAFLFDTHSGYCQQFSGSMALLLRMGGVPARVAAGFTAGRDDLAQRTWDVTDIDAHAWDEVWFPTYGWVRFDPTPSTAPAIATSSLIDRTLDRRRVSPTPAGQVHALRPVATGHRPTVGATHHHVRRGRGGSGPEGWWPWLVAGVLAGAIVVARLVQARRRDRGGGRGRSDPLAELERALVRTGRPLADSTTLVELERRFDDSPAAAGYVRALRLHRFGGGGAPPTPAGRRAVRTELAAGLGLSGRLRALWALPPRRRRL